MSLRLNFRVTHGENHIYILIQALKTCVTLLFLVYFGTIYCSEIISGQKLSNLRTHLHAYGRICQELHKNFNYLNLTMYCKNISTN